MHILEGSVVLFCIIDWGKKTYIWAGESWDTWLTWYPLNKGNTEKKHK